MDDNLLDQHSTSKKSKLMFEKCTDVPSQDHHITQHDSFLLHFYSPSFSLPLFYECILKDYIIRYALMVII